MFPDIPYDILLQICKSCSKLEDLFSLRRVCRTWNFFFRERDIWVHLVSSFPGPTDSPRLHYTERPICDCSAAELAKIYQRWRMAEKAWQSPEECFPNVTQLDLGPGYLPKASILAPGGRWLIVFTNLVQAFCYDLDSHSPGPIVIIPPQFASKRDLLPEAADCSSYESDDVVHVEVSGPEVDHIADNLSFHVVVTYGAMPFNSTVQVWKFETVFDDATGLSSITAYKSWSFSPEYGFLRCRSFLGSILVLEAPNMDVGPGLPSEASKFLICDWREAKDSLSDFSLRTLFTYKSVDQVQLLRGSHIVLYSLDEGLVMYDYASIPIYTGPRQWGRIINLYADIKKRLSLALDFYFLISKPYYVASSEEYNESEEDSESEEASEIEEASGEDEEDLPAGSLILCNDDGQIHEMDIEADIDIKHTSMAPIWYLGEIQDSNSGGNLGIQSDENPKKFQVCLGYWHAACITQGQLKLMAYWRGPADDGKPTVKTTGIEASNIAGLQIDEGSGRIVISDTEKNCIRVVDIAV